MVTLDASKTLGGVGALLLFIGVFPYINTFGIVDIIGVILILVALHGFADYYKERRIFNNAIYGVIAAIVGIVIAAVIGIAIVLPSITSFLEKLYPSWNGSLPTITSQGMTPNTSKISLSDVEPFIVAAIVVFVILWIFAIITAFFVRRSLEQTSSKTSVKLFSTAGLLLLIGAVLTIIIIGLLLTWIAALLLAIAFFQTRPQQPQPPAPARPSN